MVRYIWCLCSCLSDSLYSRVCVEFAFQIMCTDCVLFRNKKMHNRWIIPKWMNEYLNAMCELNVMHLHFYHFVSEKELTSNWVDRGEFNECVFWIYVWPNVNRFNRILSESQSTSDEKEVRFWNMVEFGRQVCSFFFSYSHRKSGRTEMCAWCRVVCSEWTNWISMGNEYSFDNVNKLCRVVGARLKDKDICVWCAVYEYKFSFSVDFFKWEWLRRSFLPLKYALRLYNIFRYESRKTDWI